MYNIDLSFLQSDAINEEELKKTENDCNDKFQHLIIHHANGEEKLVEDCRCHKGDAVSEDSRIIVEAICDGILGLHYASVSNNVKRPLEKGDRVVVKNNDFFDIATITETENMVRFKRSKCGCANEELPSVERVLSENDLINLEKNIQVEDRAKPVFFKLVEKYSLNMKLIKIHFQFDKKKLFFFYTSDGRVDFRQLAKDLASEFKTRIELRQMGVRDEAKEVGGVGTCGREYCCSSFISNFKRISTQHACEQNLTSNLSKLSGPCNKLKCCLSFELD